MGVHSRPPEHKSIQLKLSSVGGQKNHFFLTDHVEEKNKLETVSFKLILAAFTFLVQKFVEITPQTKQLHNEKEKKEISFIKVNWLIVASKLPIGVNECEWLFVSIC